MENHNQQKILLVYCRTLAFFYYIVNLFKIKVSRSCRLTETKRYHFDIRMKTQIVDKMT